MTKVATKTVTKTATGNDDNAAPATDTPASKETPAKYVCIHIYTLCKVFLLNCKCLFISAVPVLAAQELSQPNQ